MKTSRILLLAAAAGATAAAYYLLRTEKGKELRAQLGDSASELGDEILKFAESAGDRFSKLRSEVLDNVDGISKDARRRILNILDEGTSQAKKVSKKARAVAAEYE